MTLLDQVVRAVGTCKTCGGTILSATVKGVSRGSCHCTGTPSKPVGSAPRDCCKAVIAEYESVDGTAVAKQRGGVALFCRACHARLEYADRWTRIGGKS